MLLAVDRGALTLGINHCPPLTTNSTKWLSGGGGAVWGLGCSVCDGWVSGWGSGGGRVAVW